MMTSRMAVGSVSTLAVAAMLLGAAPYFITRALGPSHASPWGALSAEAATAGSVDETSRAQLLKLAAFKTAVDQAPAPAAVETVAANEASDKISDAPASLVTAVANDSVPAADPAPETTASQDQQNAPMQFAALETPAQSAPAAAAAARLAGAAPGPININTASMESLDHFPGVGRIGHAIVVHRPYRSVADLLHRRILRMSDFQKIQSRIRVD